MAIKPNCCTHLLVNPPAFQALLETELSGGCTARAGLTLSSSILGPFYGIDSIATAENAGIDCGESALIACCSAATAQGYSLKKDSAAIREVLEQALKEQHAEGVLGVGSHSRIASAWPSPAKSSAVDPPVRAFRETFESQSTFSAEERLNTNEIQNSDNNNLNVNGLSLQSENAGDGVSKSLQMGGGNDSDDEKEATVGGVMAAAAAADLGGGNFDEDEFSDWDEESDDELNLSSNSVHTLRPVDVEITTAMQEIDSVISTFVLLEENDD